MNYRDFLQKIIYNVIDPFIDLMIKLGLTPNAITATGFIGNLFAMFLFIEAAQTTGGSDLAFQYIGWGGAVILFAGLFDMMDGRLWSRSLASALSSSRGATSGLLWASSPLRPWWDRSW